MNGVSFSSMPEQKLTQLTRLNITDFKQVRNLTPLANLENLEVLAVEGGIWPAMRVKSLMPIGELKKLRKIFRSNCRTDDNSLKPLGKLPNLEHLSCANRFPMEEFAWLSGANPKLACDWFEPASNGKAGLNCKKCGENRAILLCGNGAGLKCPDCDAKAIQKPRDLFNEIRQRATAGKT